jgi:YD repeat-containing protein
MKIGRPIHGLVSLGRMLAVFVFLSVAPAAYAVDCLALFPKSGAVQGDPTCPLIVASNTPSGEGAYICRNDIDLIRSWCASTPDGDPDGSCPVSDPVYPITGATLVEENDFVSGDDVPMFFRRTYRAQPLFRPDAKIGTQWIHNWQRQLGLASAGNNPPQVFAYREDGNRVTFGRSGSAWRAVDRTPLTLAQSSSSWTITDWATGTVETYSLQGVLQSVSGRYGFTTTLTYSDANTPANVAPTTGLLIAVTQHFAGSNPYNDLTLRLAYDAKSQITQLTDPTGAVTQYGYDAKSNLVSVTWPDGNVRRYAYEDKRFTSALTGIVNETGSRIATWTYDGKARVTGVNHPDTNRNVQFAYGNGATIVSDSKGSNTLTFSPVAGVQRPVSVSSPSGSSSRAFDAYGNLISLTTNGVANVQYTYDDADRPVKKVVSDASGTFTTSVRYVDATSLRPSSVMSPGLRRSYAYDENGNVAGIDERPTDDPTGVNGFSALSSSGLIRTVGIQYDFANRPNYIELKENGVLTRSWSGSRDATGNLRLLVDRQNADNSVGVTLRDAAHRAVQFRGPGFIANTLYDSRGRLTLLQYLENAGPINGGVQRFLKINFSYSADGKVVSRTGTVSTNLGPDAAISSDEIDTWLTNYETGVAPAGPPPNRLGWVKSQASANTSAIDQPCGDCYLFAGGGVQTKLYYNDPYFNLQLGRFNSAIPSEPITDATLAAEGFAKGATPKVLLGAKPCGDGCVAEEAACRAICNKARTDFDQIHVWGGSMRRCMSGCLPARCGGA